MVKSMFSGISGLRSHQQKMDVIGNNIANVNTFGYKSGRVTFKESIYQTTMNSSNGNEIYGGSNPSQIGYGSQVGTIDLMFTTGAYAPTDSATDCMIDGQGFFLVGKKPTESGRAKVNELILTRVGNFVLDGDGYLVDGNKNVVYGVPGTPDPATGNFTPEESGTEEGYEELIPVRVPKADGSAATDNKDLMNLSGISIDASGFIIGTNAANNVPTKIGKIALANVPNPNALEKTQGPYYKVVNNTGEVKAFAPGIGSTGKLLSNGLEMANVDLAKEFSEMITTQRGFQANTRIITVTDEMLQELVNLKR